MKMRGLSLYFCQLECWGIGSTIDAIPLPQRKPWAMREHFIVPPIRSREAARAEWPNIRHGKGAF